MKNITIVYTGNGKGKTSAAFGQALRAVGQGLNVCIIQFIKSNARTGEVKAMKAFAGQIEVHVKGTGFTWEADDLEEVKAAARDAWEFAKRQIYSGDFQMVILDEITYPVNYDIISEKDVIRTIKERPGCVHLVLTGREASAPLIESADIVTEMKEIKHCYNVGVSAAKGIDF